MLREARNMTAIPKSAFWITPEEYLDGERLAEVRHEYVAGQVYAMAGASDAHNAIASNIHGELYIHLKGKLCRVFAADMKVRTAAEHGSSFYYPDVFVACEPADSAKYFRERPKVIFEIVSPDSERTDRREKATAYYLIPSVECYVIVEQERVAMTVLRRGPHGWKPEQLEGKDAVLRIECLDFAVPLATLYERTGL
jgi:Uma2 family endonuclease